MVAEFATRAVRPAGGGLAGFNTRYRKMIEISWTGRHGAGGGGLRGKEGEGVKRSTRSEDSRCTRLQRVNGSPS